jgi:hypothetical protein
MNASYQWLKDFVDIDMSATELRDLLTMRCATVDDVVALRADLADIVIGKVIEAGLRKSMQARASCTTWYAVRRMFSPERCIRSRL